MEAPKEQQNDREAPTKETKGAFAEALGVSAAAQEQKREGDEAHRRLSEAWASALGKAPHTLTLTRSNANPNPEKRSKFS